MAVLNIIVQALDKADAAEPDIIAEMELEFASMVILEKGTTEGDTSVSFRLVDSEGKSYLAQLTGNIFRTAFGAFKGADERFKFK